MEITLEKIELVKDRTGVTYAEAKKALEDADGSVVDAIISIEETVNSGDKGRGFGEKGEELFKSLKNLVKKGNVAKIQVKRDGELILNVPVNAGIVGLCIAPLASVVAIVAAFGFKCVIEVVKTDGTIIDVSDTVTEKMAAAAEFSNDKFGDIKEKSKKYYDIAKEKADDIKEKAEDSDFYDKAKEKVDDIKEKAEDIAEDIKSKVKIEIERNEGFDMSDVEEEEGDKDIEIEIEIGEQKEEEEK